MERAVQLRTTIVWCGCQLQLLTYVADIACFVVLSVLSFMSMTITWHKMADGRAHLLVDEIWRMRTGHDVRSSSDWLHDALVFACLTLSSGLGDTYTAKCGVTNALAPDFAHAQRTGTLRDVKRTFIAEMSRLSTQVQQGSNIFHSKQNWFMRTARREVFCRQK